MARGPCVGHDLEALRGQGFVAVVLATDRAPGPSLLGDLVPLLGEPIRREGLAMWPLAPRGGGASCDVPAVHPKVMFMLERADAGAAGG